MGKDPAFLFYPGDWLGGTMGMTFEEKGAYLELLLFQFNNGKFSKAQAKQVLSICSASVVDKVLLKFNTDGTFFWKQRLTDEIERRRKFSESRQKNANSKKTPLKNEKAYAKHMETETENRNEDVNGIDNKKEDDPNFILVDSEKVFDVVKLLEIREAALNGRCSEHKIQPWRVLVPPWFAQNIGGSFKDTNHVFNAFSKFIISTNEQRSKIKGGNGQSISGQHQRKPFKWDD